MKTITHKTKVWALPGGMYDTTKELNSKNAEFFIYSNCAESMSNYMQVGEAEITIRVFDDAEVMANQITALQSQIKTVRADSEAQVNRLQGRINDLLALTYEPAGEQA